MRTELEQERRMAESDQFGDAAGETARRMADMRRRRKREQRAWYEDDDDRRENP